MKRHWFIVVCLVTLVASLPVTADWQASSLPHHRPALGDASARPAGRWTAPTTLKLSTLVGEQLDYVVSWADYVVAARITMQVKPAGASLPPEGLQLQMQAQTVGVVKSLVMALEHELVSWIDGSSALPTRHEKHSREGTRRVDLTTIFDHERRVAQVGEKKIPIEAETRDIVSFWYFLRTLDLSSGKHYRLHVLSDDQRVTILVSPEQKSVIDVGGAPVEAVSVALRVEETQGRRRRRINDDYRVRVWLSHDEKRTPVLITAKPPFGDIRVRLVKPEKPES
ncbi:MAG: DUF3108 domain-containing protein [Acidobacteriota bacterium]|nr:DUF3108 domain-containing protein [Blastocatellia bacterium]MDW8238744.1 DUF3108 domain-containing protein [Acidobacteriota bacterium]